LILNQAILADLAVAITPKAYVRVTPIAHEVVHALRLIDAGESPRNVADTFRVGRTTLWRALKAAAA